ncbi:MAG TPA: CBS domain-containing protein [Bacillota bacterium]|nr:CBS domain-containing protein [Bacillota bacterium]
MLVKEVMTGPVIMVTTDDPVEKCANLMLKHNISGLPVTDQSGRVVGMVTEGDLIRRASRIKAPGYLEILGGLVFLGSPTKFINEIKRAMSLTAGEMMTKKVVSVGTEESIEQAATLMVEHEVNRLPVLNEAGELAGIVSRRDIMKHLYAK